MTRVRFQPHHPLPAASPLSGSYVSNEADKLKREYHNGLHLPDSGRHHALLSEKGRDYDEQACAPDQGDYGRAGELRTSCRARHLPVFHVNQAITDTIMQEGRMQPKVAQKRRKNGNLQSYEGGRVIAIGPGVIWEIVTKSVNSTKRKPVVQIHHLGACIEGMAA